MITTTIQKPDLLHRSLTEFCEMISEPEVLQLCNLNSREKQIISLLFKERKNLEEVCQSFQLSPYSVMGILNKALLTVKEKLQMKLKTISELGRIRAEIDHLKNENDTYKKRFALLPVTVMHIRSSSHLLNHNMPKDLQPLEAMAEKMGGFVGITSRFKNVTTIAFSFPNMPLAA